jgi:hypothetical protein
MTINEIRNIPIPDDPEMIAMLNSVIVQWEGRSGIRGSAGI